MNVNAMNRNVFIVDDDESVSRSLSRLLTLEGFNVTFYPSADHFFNAVSREAMGCVISDVYMPETNGFMLHQKMTERGYHLPIIFISAHAGVENREYALSHGGVGFLLKPFDEKSLISLVQKAVMNS